MSINYRVSRTSEEKVDDNIMKSSIFRHSDVEYSSYFKRTVDDKSSIYSDDTTRSLSYPTSAYLSDSDRSIPMITRATAIGLTCFESPGLVENTELLFTSPSSQNENKLLYIEDSIMDKVEDDLPLFMDEVLDTTLTRDMCGQLSEEWFIEQSSEASFDKNIDFEARESRSVRAELADTAEVSRTLSKPKQTVNEEFETVVSASQYKHLQRADGLISQKCSMRKSYISAMA